MASYDSALTELESIKNSFNSQCMETSTHWNDSLKDKFYGEYVNDYGYKIDQYIYQVKDLGTLLEIKKREIADLANISKY